MPAPTLPRPKFNFSTIPDPDTLPPDVRAKMLAQPWFNQVLDLHESGVEITPDLMEKLATRPGAMGFKLHEFDAGDGKKMKGLFDVATGELVPPDKLIKPDFEPTLRDVKDPVTGQPAGRVLMTSSNSAVPYRNEDQGDMPLMNQYKTSVLLGQDNEPIAEVWKDPKGNIHVLKKGADLGPFAEMFNRLNNGGNTTQPQPTPAKPATSQAAPVKPAAPQAAPSAAAFMVKDDADFARLKSGDLFIGPDGIKRRKP